MNLLTILIAFIFGLTSALHLDVPALPHPEPVCVRDFVQEEQLVVINIKTDGRVGDGQELNVQVVDSLGNEYRRKKNVAGNVRIAFTSHHSAAFDVCFVNSRISGSGYASREVELEIESGAAARDWNAIQASEKLKPVEIELRRVEALTEEIVSELRYLKQREERMRDTNESTNDRVKYFSIIVVLSLLGLGAWQIQYLRHYFKVKHII